MRPWAVFIFLLILVPASSLAQDTGKQYQVTESDGSETFVFPYEATNRDADNSFVYTYEDPKTPSWILSIRNNLSYVAGEDARTIVRIREPPPSEKFIEIAMYGGDSKKFWIAVNVPEVGYAKLYENKVSGWSLDEPITVSNVETNGLTANDGKRIVVDGFDLGGFAVGSIEVYGSDEAGSSPSAYQGDLTFEILFGSFSESPLYLLPAAVMAGVGGIVIGLLIFKKRKPTD